MIDATRLYDGTYGRQPDVNLSNPVERLAGFYAGKLAEHGATPEGMGWGSAAAQQARFEQLLKLVPAGESATLIDYGCGYGALADLLCKRNIPLEYWGYDVSPIAVAAATARHFGNLSVHFVTEQSSLPQADYCVASGIFNLRLDTGDDEWLAYIHETVAAMWRLARRGIAFNALTSYSDADKKRPDLYYTDPCAMFDHCKRTLSPHVALLHDYGFWDFTMIVRREAQ